jgi:hypothetical protein
MILTEEFVASQPTIAVTVTYPDGWVDEHPRVMAGCHGYFAGLVLNAAEDFRAKYAVALSDHLDRIRPGREAAIRRLGRPLDSLTTHHGKGSAATAAPLTVHSPLPTLETTQMAEISRTAPGAAGSNPVAPTSATQRNHSENGGGQESSPHLAHRPLTDAHAVADRLVQGKPLPAEVSTSVGRLPLVREGGGDPAGSPTSAASTPAVGAPASRVPCLGDVIQVSHPSGAWPSAEVYYLLPDGDGFRWALIGNEESRGLFLLSEEGREWRWPKAESDASWAGEPFPPASDLPRVLRCELVDFAPGPRQCVLTAGHEPPCDYGGADAAPMESGRAVRTCRAEEPDADEASGKAVCGTFLGDDVVCGICRGELCGLHCGGLQHQKYREVHAEGDGAYMLEVFERPGGDFQGQVTKLRPPGEGLDLACVLPVASTQGEVVRDGRAAIGVRKAPAARAPYVAPTVEEVKPTLFRDLAGIFGFVALLGAMKDADERAAAVKAAAATPAPRQEPLPGFPRVECEDADGFDFGLRMADVISTLRLVLQPRQHAERIVNDLRALELRANHAWAELEERGYTDVDDALRRSRALAEAILCEALAIAGGVR